MYELKGGEVYNGGYTVTIGDYELRNIGAYTPGWSNVYDNQNSYIDLNGNNVKALIGKQFTLSVKTGRLSKDDCDALTEQLKKGDINVECPDFSGKCICDEFNTNLEQANTLNTRYSVTFKLTAKSLTAVGSL